MKILIRVCLALIISFSLVSAGAALAQQAGSPSTTEPVAGAFDELSVAMRNTSYQFIYAFFGKDMLLSYVDNEQHESLIKAASDSDLNHLAKPFNAAVGSFVLSGMSVIYSLTVGYFLIKLLFFLKENIWYAQRKGSLTFQNSALRGILFRIVVFGALALAPWSVTTQLSEGGRFVSASHVVLMNFLGKAHQMADQAFKSLIQKTRPSSKTLNLPRADNKIGTALAMNTFFTCLRLDANRTEPAQTIPLELKRTPGGTLHGVLSQGRCHLSVTASEDIGMVESARKINGLLPKVAVNPQDLQNAQFSMIEKVLAASLKTSFNASAQLSLPPMQEEEISAENVSTQFKTSPWTSNERTPHELVRWQAGCSQLSSLQFGPAVTERDRIIYNLLTARCNSREITSSMLYPESFADVEAFLDSGPLKNRELPMCIDAATTALLAESKFTPAYALSYEEADAGRESVALEQCVVKYCASSQLGAGGLYMCSNALSALERRAIDVQAGERGIMAAGLYVFQLFTHQSPGESSKKMYRTLNAEFSQSAFQSTSGDVVISIPVSLPAVEPLHGNKMEDTLSSLQAAPDSEMSVWLDPPPDHENWLEKMTQHSRLMTCVKNPMQMTSGYVCGNVPQEFNRFGMNLLRAAIAAKTLLVVGDAVTRNGSPGPGHGTIGRKMITSSVVKLTAWLGASYYADTVIDGVLASGFSMTDEFGYWDQTQTREWLSYSNLLTAALALGLSNYSSAVQMIDSALFFALIIGIVFAFLIPLFPLLLVLSALAKLFVLLFVNICMTGFRLVNCAFERDSEHFLGSEFDQLWSDWVATLLKMPLTIIGLGLAWLMSNVIVAHVLRRIDLTMITNDGATGFLDTMVLLIVSMVIIYVVYNMVLTIIESFYDFTVEWVLGQMTNNPYGDRRGVGMKDSAEIMKMLTGRAS